MSHRASLQDKAKPVVTLDDVSLRLYEGVPFKGLHWEILSNQHWAVVGPNGSGKSTLMRAICGQVPVVRGTIAYRFGENGAPAAQLDRGALANKIAYVAFDSRTLVVRQDSSFHQARWNRGVIQDTVAVAEVLSEQLVRQINPYQIVEGAADPAEFRSQRDRVVEQLGIEPLLTKSAHQISNGERRKVMMAQALLKNPRLLILDNPFTGLDASYRGHLAETISGLMQDDMRVILVTNGRTEIPPGITHVLFMAGHQIVSQGAKETVLGHVPATQQIDPERPKTELRLYPDREPEDKPGSEIVVCMENVNVTYDDCQVLKGINWTVRKGEKWALTGPNGAGKTTLLSLILGDNPQAYANKITLFGRRRGSGESIWEIKRRIGWVAPELHLAYPKNVACFDVVCSGFFDSIGRHHRTSPAQREIAAQQMQRLGIGEHGGTRIGAVSEGEQRMVLVARALVKSPELLVLDEPCQGLDAGNRDRVLDAIETMDNQQNTSIIYVTHHLDALPAITTHVIRLDEGRMVSREKVERTNLAE